MSSKNIYLSNQENPKKKNPVEIFCENKKYCLAVEQNQTFQTVLNLESLCNVKAWTRPVMRKGHLHEVIYRSHVT